MPAPNFEMRPLQREIARDKARFKVLRIHRRAGKTVYGINWLREGWEQHNPEIGEYRGLFVSGFKSQSKANVWQFLRQYTADLRPKYDPSEGLVTFKSDNGQIQLLGAAKGWYHLHRGRSAHRIVLDEAADIEPDAWRSVFRPMLADTNGQALIQGTPHAEGDFLDECFKNEAKGVPEWKSWSANVYETGIIPDHEIDQLRIEEPEHIFEREFMCNPNFPDPGSYFQNEMKSVRVA